MAWGNGGLFRGFYNLAHTSIDSFGHLFGGVSKQPASVCQLNLAGRFGANVLELKLADQHCQCRVAVGAGLDGRFLAGFISAIAQHLLAHPMAGCVGDQPRCFNAVEGPAFL